MNDFFSRLVLFQAYFPNLCLFLISALKVGGCVLLTQGVVLLLRSRSSRARCWVWRCSLVGVLTLMIFDFMPASMAKFRWNFFVSPETNQAQTFLQEVRTLKLVQSEREFDVAIKTKKREQPSASLSPWKVKVAPVFTVADYRRNPWSQIESNILAIWGWGAAALLLLTSLIAGIGVHQLRRRSLPANEDLQSFAYEVADRFAPNAVPRIYLTAHLRSPLLMGIRQPEIFLPHAAAFWNQEKWRSVFLHELAHWQRGDLVWQYLGKLSACLFWWNPLVAIAARRMSAESEEAADDWVLLHSVSAKTYAAALVEIASASGTNHSSTTGIPMVGRHSLKGRIQALLVDNPWRGKMGRRGTVLTVALCVILAASATVHFNHTAILAESPKNAVRKLSPDQRIWLRTIIAANTARMSALRFLHFKLEKNDRKGSETGPFIFPQPTKMEAWVDTFTGVHRVEFRPRVTRWENGASPFYIENLTEINDGKQFYRISSHDDLNNLTGREPQGLGNYLGFSETIDLLRISELLLSRDSLGEGMVHHQIDQEKRGNKILTRICEQFMQGGKVTQQRTFLLDPERDNRLVFCETAFPASRPDSPIQFMVLHWGKTMDGILYPELYQKNYSIGVKRIEETKVTSVEVLPSLPNGITDLPKSPSAKYVSDNQHYSQPGSIILSWQNAVDGTPVAQVNADVRINLGGYRHHQGASDSQLTVDLPAKEITNLVILASAPGFALHEISWTKRGNPLQLPATYVVKLNPSALIFGKVLNEEKQPIAGAQVDLALWGSHFNGEVFRDYSKISSVVKTDDAGRWKLDNAPVDLEGLTLRVSAAEYQPTTDSGTGDFRHTTGQTYASLRDGTCVVILRHGSVFRGHVQDVAGHPLVKCQLIIGKDRFGTNLPVTETDTEGNFVFKGLTPGKNWLTVESPFHLPYDKEFNFPIAKPLQIVLQPGHSVRAKVVKADGTPCSGLNVSVDQWKNLRTLRFETQTDAEGRFQWKGAPAEPVEFVFGACQNREFLAGLPLIAQEAEQTVVMKPALQLQGKVIDKMTQKLISNVKVTLGYAWPDSDVQWQKESVKTHANGEFDWKTDRMGDPRIFLIEADGYDSLKTQVFETKQQELRETFRLTPHRK